MKFAIWDLLLVMCLVPLHFAVRTLGLLPGPNGLHSEPLLVGLAAAFAWRMLSTTQPTAWTCVLVALVTGIASSAQIVLENAVANQAFRGILSAKWPFALAAIGLESAGAPLIIILCFIALPFLVTTYTKLPE